MMCLQRSRSVKQSKSRSKSKWRNAFINFLHIFRLEPENHGKRQTEIAKLGGKKWSSMNESERALYSHAAMKVRDKELRISKRGNAFINFLYTFRLQPENYGKRQTEIAKLGGEKWRSMSESEMALYTHAAKKVRDKYARIKNTRTTKCGHKLRGPGGYGGSTDSFDKKPQTGDNHEDKTSVASDSRDFGK